VQWDGLRFLQLNARGTRVGPDFEHRISLSSATNMISSTQSIIPRNIIDWKSTIYKVIGRLYIGCDSPQDAFIIVLLLYMGGREQSIIGSQL